MSLRMKAMLEMIINMDHQVININTGVAIVMYTRVRHFAEANEC